MAANPILYPEGQKAIDHEVVIKYIPFVGDSKRAMDEYSSQIFMGGTNTISSYNVCEDSLLATPLTTCFLSLEFSDTNLFSISLSARALFTSSSSSQHPAGSRRRRAQVPRTIHMTKGFNR